MVDRREVLRSSFAEQPAYPRAHPCAIPRPAARRSRRYGRKDDEPAGDLLASHYVDQLEQPQIAAAPAPGADARSGSAPSAAPGGDVERQVAEAWQRVLGLDQIDVHENVFDLGGDSIQAIRTGENNAYA